MSKVTRLDELQHPYIATKADVADVAEVLRNSFPPFVEATMSPGEVLYREFIGFARQRPPSAHEWDSATDKVAWQSLAKARGVSEARGDVPQNVTRAVELAARASGFVIELFITSDKLQRFVAILSAYLGPEQKPEANQKPECPQGCRTKTALVEFLSHDGPRGEKRPMSIAYPAGSAIRYIQHLEEEVARLQAET